MSAMSSAMEEPQCQALGFEFILSFLGLLPDVFFDLFFSNPGTCAPDKIASNPDLSSPVFFFEPRIFFKQELGRYAFQNLWYASRSNARRRAR